MNETFEPGYDPLQSFIDLFADVDTVADTGPKMDELPLEERMRRHIIDGEKEGLHDCLDAAMGVYAPLDIINEHLLDGMKTVGELFGFAAFGREAVEVEKSAAFLSHGEVDPFAVEGNAG